MLGAIIGDIVGSRWEFNPMNDYDFELFSKDCDFTDDTICTVAVAEALLDGKAYGKTMHEWCRRYPHPMGGYGCSFRKWVMSDEPKAYGSYGNGAAMRVSPIGWAFEEIERVGREAELSAICTHSHEEGRKGARTVAMAVRDCLDLRSRFDGIGRNEIVMGLRRALEYSGYDINIRRKDVENRFDETCQGTVPVALWIISNSTSFEDAIRQAVSLGADADTLGAIVGGIAEAIWGIPYELADKAMSYLPEEMKKVVIRFYDRYGRNFDFLYHLKETCGFSFRELPREIQEKYAEQLALMFWKLSLGNPNKVYEGEDPLPDKSKVADASSWNIGLKDNDGNAVEIPEEDFSVMPFRMALDREEMAVLRRGHIPEVQEDHWFMYCDEEYIRYYRSWTGMIGFEAHYHQEGDSYLVDRLKVNHHLCEFGLNGDEPAAFLFRYLLAAELGKDSVLAWNEFARVWAHTVEKYQK